jgi:hypothetical protein
MRTALAATFLIAMGWISPAAQAEVSCELTPLTLPLFDGTPVVEMATPAATPAIQALTEDEATDILEMYVACTNTGDPTLVWAMFTPRWFADQFADPEEHYLPAFEYGIATGHDQVVEPLLLQSIDDIVLLDGGRVAVTATFASGAFTWTDQLILTNIDGQWFIDEVVLLSPPA